MNIGMQIYGLRNELEHDFEGTLAKVADMGVTGVELFGAHKSASDTKAILGRLNLTPVAAHVTFDTLEADLEGQIARAKEIGASILVCAWSKASDQQTWEQIADALERHAQACNAQGLEYAYHNHDHELTETVNGIPALDVIATRAPSVKLELDTAWLHAGGVKPSSYLEKYANRTVLVHIKDLRKTATGWETVELGQGEVDLADIIAAAKKTSSQWLLLEQDNSPTPLESHGRNTVWLKANS
jgi:sugar phosphate isomerase/epimerase